MHGVDQLEGPGFVSCGHAWTDTVFPILYKSNKSNQIHFLHRVRASVGTHPVRCQNTCRLRSTDSCSTNSANIQCRNASS